MIQYTEFVPVEVREDFDEWRRDVLERHVRADERQVVVRKWRPLGARHPRQRRHVRVEHGHEVRYQLHACKYYHVKCDHNS